jgi:hypothetical protein
MDVCQHSAVLKAFQRPNQPMPALDSNLTSYEKPFAKKSTENQQFYFQNIKNLGPKHK